MAMAGMIAEEYRLPLCEMSASNRKLLRDTLVACGIDLAS
jgi:4-hydroxy-tetrahydrodipicolinate synthase